MNASAKRNTKINQEINKVLPNGVYRVLPSFSFLATRFKWNQRQQRYRVSTEYRLRVAKRRVKRGP